MPNFQNAMNETQQILAWLLQKVCNDRLQVCSISPNLVNPITFIHHVFSSPCSTQKRRARLAFLVACCVLIALKATPNLGQRKRKWRFSNLNQFWGIKDIPIPKRIFQHLTSTPQRIFQYPKVINSNQVSVPDRIATVWGRSPPSLFSFHL